MRMMVRRRGFSLVEMLVVMVVAGIALAAVYRTLIVQQKSYRHEGARITTQQSGRTAVHVLAAELREISASGGDLLMIAPESLTVRVPRKLGIVCAVTSGTDNLEIWLMNDDAPFVKGDSVVVYVDGNETTASDDIWVRDAVSSVAGVSLCLTDWNGRPRVALHFSGPVVSQPIQPGATIRSDTTLTYGIHQLDAGEWVLGRHGTDAAEGIVPLVGPVAPPPDGGIEFTYYKADGSIIDVSGGPVTAPSTTAQVARIEVSAASRSRGPVNPNGTYYLDTLSMQVYLRNN